MKTLKQFFGITIMPFNIHEFEVSHPHLYVTTAKYSAPSFPIIPEYWEDNLTLIFEFLNYFSQTANHFNEVVVEYDFFLKAPDPTR